jgi:hypothetical protein
MMPVLSFCLIPSSGDCHNLVTLDRSAQSIFARNFKPVGVSQAMAPSLLFPQNLSTSLNCRHISFFTSVFPVFISDIYPPVLGEESRGHTSFRSHLIGCDVAKSGVFSRRED